MPSSSSKAPAHLRLHVDTTATPITNGSAASPGSASSSHSSSRSPHPTGGGGGSGQNQACAACKYQRRKCNPDCPLAPYFPADQQQRFLNAHKLFGVSNIQKTLRRIDPKLGPDAMTALIYESDARAADPVGGCVRIIEALQRELHSTRKKLDDVRKQIQSYRVAAAAAEDPAMMLPDDASADATVMAGQDSIVGVDALYAGPQPIIPAAAAGSGGLMFHDQPPYIYYSGTAGDEATSDDGRIHQYGFTDVHAGVKVESPAVVLREQMEQQCQREALPFVDAFNLKSEVLPATMRHHGPGAADDDVHQEQKLDLAAFLKHDVDEHMEEQATAAGAPCHLELGFSSI